MKNKILIPFFIFVASAAFANNLQITGVAVNQTTQLVTFTLSWDNSWNVAAAPNNWDAAWVFITWRRCSDGDATPFTHGTLSATTSDHSYTNLQAMTSVTGGAVTQSVPQGGVLDFTDGLMLAPAIVEMGSISSSVSMKDTNQPPLGTNVTVSVFAIEMVYIPQGNFTAGDGTGAATSQYSIMGSNALNATGINITTANETGPTTFYFNNESAPGNVQTVTAVPAAFPKGQYGFYCMKYEISEGQYTAFLNNLGYISAPAGARYPGNYTANRNQLNGGVPPYTTNRQDRAQNWLSWADVSAYLDWACLRPMTELEYEKACRGIAAPVLGDYAWGNTVISTGLALTFSGAGVENGTETVTAGNCIYGGAAPTFTNGDAGQGPSRCGIFATAASTRVTAGASYYGVMDMTGNVREAVVAIAADASGAASEPGTTNTFNRSWGDGAIDPVTGNHNVATWPGALIADANTAITNYVGHKGGAWNNAIAQLTISERWYVYNAPVISRQSYNGGRGVR